MVYQYYQFCMDIQQVTLTWFSIYIQSIVKNCQYKYKVKKKTTIDGDFTQRICTWKLKVYANSNKVDILDIENRLNFSLNDIKVIKKSKIVGYCKWRKLWRPDFDLQ